MFGVAKPNTYNVMAFFLQLIALRLIQFKVIDKDKIVCMCTESEGDKYSYEDPLNWKVLSFRSAKRGCHLVDFGKVVENHR